MILTARTIATSRIEAERMIEFAKLHVEAALKEASKQATLRIEETNTSIRYKNHYNGKTSQTWIVAEDSILNAYPLNLIK